MPPQSVVMDTGRIITVVNNIKSGYACDAMVDPITGKVFVSASRMVKKGYGYIGIGGGHYWYEYDPMLNSWTQKGAFAGWDRCSCAGFVIGTNGYLFGGYRPYEIRMNDFFKYNQTTGLWTIVTLFTGVPVRSSAIGFSIGAKGYIGTGIYHFDSHSGFTTRLDDFWEYDSLVNTWTKKANVPGSPRNGAVGFSIGSKGYVVGGEASHPNDCWEYNPAENTWTKKANIPVGRMYAAGFSIGEKGYVGTGYTTGLAKDFYEYNPATNTWTQKADFGGLARWDAVGFSIGNKGYIGAGNSSNDFWEYNPTTDIWIQKASFSTTSDFGFSIT